MMDKVLMDMALNLAALGRGRTSPNPMVGAVLVKNGRVVGTGYHERVGGPHAEVNAIADAGDAAAGATLYVTLEPCNHTGRTPPCTEAILAAGISRVVVAMADPNPDVAGGGNARLTASGVEVVCGVCESRARRLNEAFITHATTGQPFVILKWAATLDGQLATRTGDSKWVTGEGARAQVHALRHAVDAICVGMGTIRADDPSLTTRLENASAGADPVRVILDPTLSIPLDARVLRVDSNAETLIIGAPGASQERRERLLALGLSNLDVIDAPESDAGIDLAALMPILGARQITSLLIEGGGRVMGSAMAAGIADKGMFFYAPKLLGGHDGVPAVRGAGPASMADATVLDDTQVHRFGDDILIEGYFPDRQRKGSWPNPR